MLYPFFEQASRSPSRQRAFRRLLIVHQLVLLGVAWLGISARDRNLFELLAFTLLVCGIVEGALVLGWRLTQLPKSPSLESLLLSPLPAPLVLLGEQMVGLSLLAMLSISSAPLLALFVGLGWLDPAHAALAILFALTWGCITGFGLTWWAYEPERVRNWGERVMFVGMMVYFLVGALATEQLFRWFVGLPSYWRIWIVQSIRFTMDNNPFGVIHRMNMANEPGLGYTIFWLQVAALGAIFLFVFRAGYRLKAHYIEQNYRPIGPAKGKNRGYIGDRPLTWWAVRRVNQYPGQINLWLSLGTSLAYSLHLLLADSWPNWLDTKVFEIFERLGGISGFTVVLVLLTAVPAAYQYGLWDSSIPERCRRLEVFLLTKLSATDYLAASWWSSWNRGRGYLLTALLLWIAGWSAGRFTFVQASFALASSLALLLFYFAIGFRLFARNTESTSVGFLMTVVLPLMVWGMGSTKWAEFARFTPPGLVFYSTRGDIAIGQILVLLAMVAISAWLLRRACDRFDSELRSWYDENHGRKT